MLFISSRPQCVNGWMDWWVDSTDRKRKSYTIDLKNIYCDWKLWLIIFIIRKWWFARWSCKSSLSRRSYQLSNYFKVTTIETWYLADNHRKTIDATEIRTAWAKIHNYSALNANWWSVSLHYNDILWASLRLESLTLAVFVQQIFRPNFHRYTRSALHLKSYVMSFVITIKLLAQYLLSCCNVAYGFYLWTVQCNSMVVNTGHPKHLVHCLRLAVFCCG